MCWEHGGERLGRLLTPAWQSLDKPILKIEIIKFSLSHCSSNLFSCQSSVVSQNWCLKRAHKLQGILYLQIDVSQLEAQLYRLRNSVLPDCIGDLQNCSQETYSCLQNAALKKEDKGMEDGQNECSFRNEFGLWPKIWFTFWTSIPQYFCKQVDVATYSNSLTGQLLHFQTRCLAQCFCMWHFGAFWTLWIFVSLKQAEGPIAIKFAQWASTRPDILPRSASCPQCISDYCTTSESNWHTSKGEHCNSTEWWK